MSVLVTSLIPLSSKFILQYLLWDKGENSFKQFSFTASTMLNILSRGCWRDTAEEEAPGALPATAPTAGVGVRTCRGALTQSYAATLPHPAWWSPFHSPPCKDSVCSRHVHASALTPSACLLHSLQPRFVFHHPEGYNMLPASCSQQHLHCLCRPAH